MSTSSELNVWTVLWVGDGPFVYDTKPLDYHSDKGPDQRLYKPWDVIRYERMVRRHLPDCRFRCLSNVAVPGIETVPLKSGMVGWWPKMELFRPDLPSGRNLYFDLDTIIVRGLSEIVSYPAPFAAICPGKYVGSDQTEPWEDKEHRWRVPRYQTSVMVWDSEYGHQFSSMFTADHHKRLASDQDYLGEVWPNEARMPTEWFTRIRYARDLPRPPIKVVLAMPMRNDRAAEKWPWVRKIWFGR